MSDYSKISSEKEMNEAISACIGSDSSYKKISDKIVACCSKNSDTPLKAQKASIDKIKEVIKAPPKKMKAS